MLLKMWLMGRNRIMMMVWIRMMRIVSGDDDDVVRTSCFGYCC